MLAGRYRFIGAAIISLAFITAIGGSFFPAMVTQDGPPHGCPYMGKATICTMTPLEHLTEWQHRFMSTIPASSTLLLAAVLFGLFLMSRLWGLFVPKSPLVQKIFFYRAAVVGILDPLKLAFSRGILNPKIF